MAKIQKYLMDFHEVIKIKDTEENQELRDKRDIILNKLKQKITSDAPTYSTFNQGSYAMGTGIKPIDGEYDIDVGIRFDLSKDEYPDPLVVKKWVYDALEDHTKNVEVKRPCVTVTYLEGGKPSFHVDLAVYAAKNDDGKLYLAKGKLNSSAENKEWEISNPLELIRLIRDKFADVDDRAQFKRIIRYLKRWKDVNFSSNGHEAPVGIGLTTAAYYYLSISKTIDAYSGKATYDDLKSIRDLVQLMLNNFVQIYNVADGKCYDRLQVKLPVQPNTDLFEKMTDIQMNNFKSKLQELKETLKSAEEEVDPHEACKIMKKKFGDDFPVPPKDDTGKKNEKPAISRSSGSAKD